MYPLTFALSDPAARNAAIRLTLASIVAMTTATAFSLQNPWWAAMAVWMVGQPPRGLLLERAAAQLIGTLIGAVVGAALVLVRPDISAVSVTGLSIWIAVCCGVANVVRHQRAYGAALCGLTSAVIVVLTLETQIHPLSFAGARVLDNVIGIGSSIFVALAFGPPSPGSAITDRARTTTSQALTLVAEAFAGADTRSFAHEREFLLSLATLEATAEDMVAGSLASRRKLGDLNALFAHLLDLIVVARAIRAREVSAFAPGHAYLADLQDAFERSAQTLAEGGGFELGAIEAASRRLERADPLPSPVLEEMRSVLARAAAGYGRIAIPERRQTQRWAMPHPDVAALRLAMTRGAAATLLPGLLWLGVDWSPLRYLILGGAIFTALFSMADEPVPAVRQVFFGGFGAALLAVFWRAVLIPEIANGWLSLALAVPVMFAASLMQARKGTVFFGLALNMLFAVLARPVDVTPVSVAGLLQVEAMLLAGIATSYAFYRWLLPMDAKRRRTHLRASIRREISAISIRAGTPSAVRHLARLRYLVFSLAVRSQGRVHGVEDVLAALSVGHVLLRLGEMRSDPELSERCREAVAEALTSTSGGMADPTTVAGSWQISAADLTPADETGEASEKLSNARVRWLLQSGANDLQAHSAMFVAESLRRPA